MVGRCSGRSVLADERESSPAGSYSAADEDTLPGFKLVTLASYREVRAGGVRAAELAATCPVGVASESWPVCSQARTKACLLRLSTCTTAVGHG